MLLLRDSELAYLLRSLIKLSPPPRVIVPREVAATTPPSRPPRSWNGEGEVLGVVPLLRAEEESQVGLVVPEDVRPSEAETVILPRTPDESN